MKNINCNTPIQIYIYNNKCIYFKRDDFFKYGNICGGKVRSALNICKDEKLGFTTAGSRFSPQIQIISEIARNMNLIFHAHCPSGNLTSELIYAKNNGADIIQHKMGFNNNIISKAKKDAEENNLLYIPFGMECQEAIDETSYQVKNIPSDVTKIIVPVGSAMTLIGIYMGIIKYNLNCNIIGIIVGANPEKRLEKWIGNNWKDRIELIESGIDYHAKIKDNIFCGIELDEIYEAKCIKWLEKNIDEKNLFWIIGKGIRK
jgi:1-aminocyclopropane-1-carboxylate deaminase/D-cysteine desulfhydrase-like pyridoxal-dependent ACC family enzyme